MRMRPAGRTLFLAPPRTGESRPVGQAEVPSPIRSSLPAASGAAPFQTSQGIDHRMPLDKRLKHVAPARSRTRSDVRASHARTLKMLTESQYLQVPTPARWPPVWRSLQQVVAAA